MNSTVVEIDLDISHDPLELKSNLDMPHKVSHVVSRGEVFVSVVVASFRNPAAAVELAFPSPRPYRISHIT
jgi:hypothetical protein